MISEGTVNSTSNIAMAVKMYELVFHDWSTVTPNNTTHFNLWRM